jgi:DNA polymerase-4
LAYVDFSYLASVEQQLRLELRGKRIAVVVGETDSTSAIAANYEAKAGRDFDSVKRPLSIG